MPQNVVSKPYTILLFDDKQSYRQRLMELLDQADIFAEVHYVNVASAFYTALAVAWDVILVAHSVVDEALALINQSAADHSFVLLYHQAEENEALSMTDEHIIDLLPRHEMTRLPLILRRERRRKQNHNNSKRLQQLEMRFRAVIDGFGDTIVLVDVGQLIRYVNTAYSRIFGYSPLRILGQPVTALTPDAADRSKLQDILNRLSKDVDAIHSISHRMQRANGEWADVETTAHTIYDSAGQAMIVLHMRDITARKRAETALQASEQRLSHFVKHAPAAIAMCDRKMRYIAVSDRLLTDYRLHEEHVIGRSHYDVFPDLPEKWRTVHQRCLRGAVEHSEADPFPRADGSLDWVRWEVRPWRHANGTIGGMILFSEVITARKQAELALERSEAQLKHAESIAHLGSWTFAFKSGLTTWSDELYRICGLEPGSVEASVELLLSCIHPAYRASAAQAFTLAEQSGSAYEHEYRIIRPDGTERWVAAQGQVTVDEEAQPHTLVGTFFDITAQKLTKDTLEQSVAERTAALQRAKERVEAILNHSPDAILLIQTDLQIQQSNEAFRRLFGYRPEEEIDTSLASLIYEPDAGTFGGLTTIVTELVTEKELEIRAVRKDGTIFDVELSISAIQDDGFVCVIRDVTEKKAQERQLRFQASLQKIVGGAVIVTDMESHIQSWNHGAERLYGWHEEEVIGKTATEILRTKFNSVAERTRDIAHLRAQGWWHGELVQHSREGTPRHILSSAALIAGQNGDEIGMVAINFDITERVRAEQRLQQSAAEIHDLYNNAPCGYHSLDPDGFIVQINDTELTWIGYQRHEVVGKLKFTDVITVEGRKTFYHHYPRFKAEGSVADLQYQLVAKDGTIRHIVLSSTAIYDDSGQYVQSRSTLFDMTALRQAQMAVMESETRYRLLSETVFDMVSRNDLQGNFIYVSPSTKRLLGYESAELIGESGYSLIHPDEHAQMGELLRCASQSNDKQPSQIIQLRHKAGHYISTELTVRAIFSEETGELLEFISAARDITEQKRAEAKLRDALSKEQELGELKSRFASIASHEFRTPLATISATTESLIIFRERLDKEQLDTRLRRILEQVGHLKAIMEDVLQLSRIQSRGLDFDPTCGDLHQLCAELVEELQSLPANEDRITYRGVPAPAKQWFDVYLMRQIISNLITNSLKYSPATTPVVVTLQHAATASTLCVADRGIGIPAADMEHIFEPFHRASNVGSTSGTGLGLSITKELIEMHGGSIEVDSKLNRGTTVIVTVPTTANG